MVVSPETRSASSTPAPRLAALEELLGALVGEVQPRLHVDDRLAHHAEPEVPRLDHPGVHRADRDLVDPLPAHLGEGEGAPVVRELPRRRILPEREVVGRPERVAHEGARIRVALGRDPEEIVDLPLEARGRVVERGQRHDRGRVGGDGGARVDEPVLPLRGEEIVDFEHAAVRPPIGGGHEHQLRAEAHAKERRQRGDRRGADRAVELVAPHQAQVGHAIGVLLGEHAHELGQPGHCSTISTICRSSAWRGVGSVTPSTTRAVTQAPSGTSGHRSVSPTGTPAVGTP